MTTKPAPILIAEDDIVMAKLLTELLRHLGREIHRATTGDTILPMVQKLRPALLVLDLNMPKRNGIDVLRALRRDEAAKDLRVLVLTAQGQPETEERAREAGANDFIVKPTDIHTFLGRVRALLTGDGVAS